MTLYDLDTVFNKNDWEKCRKKSDIPPLSSDCQFESVTTKFSNERLGFKETVLQC